MNHRVRTTQVQQHIGERTEIAGWLHAWRELGSIAFAVVRDGWGVVQVVVPRARVSELASAGLESVLSVVGRVVENPQAPGGVELVEPSIEILVPVEEALPISRGQGIATAKLSSLLDHAPTVLREPNQRAVLRLCAESVAAFRQTLSERGFTEIFTPRIVGGATEGGANVFSVEYFGTSAYLAQSPQLYKQMMVGVFERVFEVGPVFRAEPHATVRHLSEYTSLDVELGFIESHLEVSELVAAVLRAMSERLRTRCGPELEALGATLPRLPEPLPSLGFAEARALLASEGAGPLEGTDLAPAEERWLGRWAEREHGSEALVVHGYPASKRPFYTHPSPTEPGATNSFDLVFRGTELVTGGQRIHRHAQLRAAMAARGMEESAFAGYLEAFRYGLPPHGGFAIGLERWVAAVCGLENIRRARAFPRDVGRLSP